MLPTGTPQLALLNRLVRSHGPWRLGTVTGADLATLGELLTAGYVALAAGLYHPTPAGRAALTRDVA